MRALGLIGLVIALVIIGVTIKKQLAVAVPVVPPQASAAGASANPGAAGAAPAQQLQQFKQSLDTAMQQPRSMPDDAK